MQQSIVSHSNEVDLGPDEINAGSLRTEQQRRQFKHDFRRHMRNIDQGNPGAASMTNTIVKKSWSTSLARAVTVPGDDQRAWIGEFDLQQGSLAVNRRSAGWSLTPLV